MNHEDANYERLKWTLNISSITYRIIYLYMYYGSKWQKKTTKREEWKRYLWILRWKRTSERTNSKNEMKHTKKKKCIHPDMPMDLNIILYSKWDFHVFFFVTLCVFHMFVACDCVYVCVLSFDLVSRFTQIDFNFSKHIQILTIDKLTLERALAHTHTHVRNHCRDVLFVFPFWFCHSVHDTVQHNIYFNMK